MCPSLENQWLRCRVSQSLSLHRRGWNRLAAAGGNCIKIGLPGKSILKDYFQENRTSRRPGVGSRGGKPLEKPPENPPENQLEISYTGKSPKIGSFDMS